GNILMFNTEDFLPLFYEVNDKVVMIPINTEVHDKLQEWMFIFNKEAEELNEVQLEIKNNFLNADKIIFKSPSSSYNTLVSQNNSAM
ncbi:34875_t:CDS:2, partial [Racocetra persica]